ncbi:Tat pathway signal sequence domain protein [Streptomyces tsukubensis]|uniref:Tat pathway signal sequence domain protein n=1 Tax=Streptomyces tsukubensis TaxID=83656 RepID=A0A1V4AFI6_9ACTN|nr:Tat pathway signal sequence domain protein [Streptomyces tsukubensis]OON82804.1 Tat pathway signal sequence domain protein [Streptomyces tsukubensis]QFR92020.1 Tat pathway signal sequence domain protein [Streptomyces tsukubensis]
MGKRTVIAAFGIAAAALLTASPANAAAGNVLTYGSAGGSAVGSGDVLTASLAPGASATIRTTAGGTTGITCGASAFTATVTGNPAAPGTATESLTAHTFGSCTTNILGTTGVQSFTVGNLPYTTTATSAGVLTVNGPLTTTVKLNTALGPTTCVYTKASLTGATSNTGNTITFTNQAFTKSSGPASCPGTGYFSATYGPVKDTSKSGSPSVFVN